MIHNNFFFWLGKINIFGLKVRHKGNPKKEQQICSIQLLVGKSIFFLVNHSFIFCKENLKAIRCHCVSKV